MTDMQITYFIQTAQTLNMSITAKQLHITQPVISRQIQSLERELGFPLFYRNKKKLTLTPSGEVMYSCFKNVLQNYHQEREKANSLFYQNTSDISIRLMEYFDNTAVYDTISMFQKKHPNVRFHIELLPASCSPEELASFKWDIIFTWESKLVNVSNYFYKRILTTEELIVISKNHLLYNNKNLTMDDFNNLPMCYTRINTLSHISHIDYSHDLSSYIPIPLHNISSVLAYVDSGLAFSILETSILPYLKCEYRTIPTGKKQHMAYGWKIDENKPFLEMFIKEYEKILITR